MKTPVWCQNVLLRFDKGTEPLHETEIADALAVARKSQGDLSDGDWKAFVAEHSAFLFIENNAGKSVWETYFAPMMSFKDDNGCEMYVPDLCKLDADSVAHWESRAGETCNPIMTARYADLVWDLKRTITGDPPDVRFARVAAASYCEAADRELYPQEMFGIGWVSRAFQIALSINDNGRAEQVVSRMFTLYERIAEPNKPGTWLFLFDCLYESKAISVEQEASVIQKLEMMLSTTTHAQPNESGVYETLDPWAAEAASERLARHYRRKGEKADVERVIRASGQAFEQMARQANPMLAMAWLQPVIEKYEREGLRKEAESLQLLAQDKGKNIESDMKTVSVQAEIKQEETEKLIEFLLGVNDLNGSLARIAGYFIPRADNARTLLNQLRTDAPFQSMIPIKILDASGFTTAQTGSLEDDPEGRLRRQLAQTVGFYQPFLSHALARLRERYAPTVDDTLNFLCESPLFAGSREDLIRDGLEAYERGDFVKAIHVLIPRVEHVLREFLGQLGSPTRKNVRNQPGITDAKNMNDVLTDSRMRTALTENLWRYLAVVYVDRRGLNFRNDLAHGLVPRAGFNRPNADMIFHTLLALSLMRSSGTTTAHG